MSTRSPQCGIRSGRCGAVQPAEPPARASAAGRWAFPAPRAALLAVLLCFTGLAALAEQRFPPPDFTETSHQIPATTAPGARAIFFQYLDVAVLAAALGMATWLVLGKRSRRWVLVLSIFSVGYFGFYRNGCVCSIGSLQNVALALGDSSYALPAAVLAFFALPLAFALFAGRVFCAGVCPHGALQDLVLLKPVKVPTWLENGLSVLPFVYLGAGVLFAATGSSFIICQYDPFIPIFRMSGRALMVLSGAGLLVLGLFVGRPFCRFLCPYGALLKIAASVAKWGVEITPDNCSKCRLCEEVCPYGAVRPPDYGQPEPAALRREARRLAWLVVLLPLLTLAGGWLGGRFSQTAALAHPTVSLAERYARQGDQAPKAGAPLDEVRALERARQNPKGLMAEAAAIRGKFRLGGRLFGAWVGLVVGAKLLSISLRRRRTEFEPDRGACVACARCIDFCPHEVKRRRANRRPAPARATLQVT